MPFRFKDYVASVLSAEDIKTLFTDKTGSFLCARWQRPVAPVIFGLADETLDVFRAALRAALADIRHPITEADPESGANWLCFAVRDWGELASVPDLEVMTGINGLPERLAAQSASTYRLFRFEADGAVRACFTFLNFGGKLQSAHPGALAEAVAMSSLATWARDIVPDKNHAAVLRAVYHPVLPDVARDDSHALRLFARTQVNLTLAAGAAKN